MPEWSTSGVVVDPTINWVGGQALASGWQEVGLLSRTARETMGCLVEHQSSLGSLQSASH